MVVIRRLLAAHLALSWPALKAGQAQYAIDELVTLCPSWLLVRLTVLAAVATFERDLMKKRQVEGIAKAKTSDLCKCRAPTVQRRADEIFALKAQGLGPAEIAKKLGVGRASVYRALQSAGGEQAEA
jgi:DNA invertase Pin-like site-specific DNA recombinase